MLSLCPYVDAMLAHFGPSLAHLGSMSAHSWLGEPRPRLSPPAPDLMPLAGCRASPSGHAMGSWPTPGILDYINYWRIDSYKVQNKIDPTNPNVNIFEKSYIFKHFWDIFVDKIFFWNIFVGYFCGILLLDVYRLFVWSIFMDYFYGIYSILKIRRIYVNIFHVS